MKNKIRGALFLLLGVVVIAGSAVWVNRLAKEDQNTAATAKRGSVLSSQDAPLNVAQKIADPAMSDVAEKGVNPAKGVRHQDTVKAAVNVPDRAALPDDDEDLDEAAEAEADGVIELLQDQLDSDDLQVVAAAAKKLMGHANKFVRLKAVDELAWAEEAGYADLKAMIYDQDPDVSRAALEAWAFETQSMDTSEAKDAAIKEVGGAALNMDAEAFDEVIDAMFEMDDAGALAILQGYSTQTDDAEMLELIYDEVNLRAMPDEMVEKKEDIPQAIAEFNRLQAEEAAEEAAAEQQE